VRLPLGRIVVSASVHERVALDSDFHAFTVACLHRHEASDWGDLDDDDRAANERALTGDGRVLSAYDVPPGYELPDDQLWIVTEADRSATTLLWPSDY
jgi:hypothetical protein